MGSAGSTVRGWLLAMAACIAGTVGCAEEEDASVDAGSERSDARASATADASPDADDAAQPEAGARTTYYPGLVEQVDKLDILLVVDDSASMAEEQTALASQLPRLLDILVSGDLEAGVPAGTEGLGDKDFRAIRDIHLGVVSTNMGVAGNAVPENPGGSPNACSGTGDDGLLQVPVNCGAGVRDGFAEFDAGRTDFSGFVNDAVCLAQLGTAGCGVEQQLEAMLKALSASAETTFYGGTTGHGAGANAGFLREDAALAVILLTDEDDCSVPEQNAAVMSFSLSGTAQLTDMGDGSPLTMDLATPLNLRCGVYEAALWPISRYVDGLLALKAGRPDQVTFAAITGIPTTLVGSAAEDILGDTSLVFRPVKPDELLAPDNRPVPSCSRDHDGDPSTPAQEAYPPRRIVELAAEFGEDGVVHSICQDDLAPAVDAVARTIADNFFDPCLRPSFDRDDAGLVDCHIVELQRMEDGAEPCDSKRGRTADGVQDIVDAFTETAISYQRCLVNQLPVIGDKVGLADDDVGAYFDDFSDDVMRQCGADGLRLKFTKDAEPTLGTLVHLECLP